MNKKIKLIIIISTIALIFIPVLVFGSYVLRIPIKIPIEYSVDEEQLRQDKLEEKNQIAKQLEEGKIENPKTIVSNEPNEMYVIEENKDEESIKIKKIIDRFYKKEMQTIQSKIEKESSEGGLDSSVNPMFEGEIELFELIVDIVKNKQITNEESEILKKYLQDNLHRVKSNDTLYNQISNLLQ